MASKYPAIGGQKNNSGQLPVDLYGSSIAVTMGSSIAFVIHSVDRSYNICTDKTEKNSSHLW